MSENTVERARMRINEQERGRTTDSGQCARQLRSQLQPLLCRFLKKGEKSLIFEKTAPSPSQFYPGKALAESFFDLQITFKLLITTKTVSFETQFAPFEA